jgi:hypothetical protein
VLVGSIHAFICQQLIQSTRMCAALTSIASLICCGRLEPFNAAEAADAKRTEAQLMRGARNAAHTRLGESRNAMLRLWSLDRGKMRF